MPDASATEQTRHEATVYDTSFVPWSQQLSDIIFHVNGGEEVLRLTSDRRVIWSGEPSEAAQKFWRTVEDMWPTFVVRTAHGNPDA